MTSIQIVIMIGVPVLVVYLIGRWQWKYLKRGFAPAEGPPPSSLKKTGLALWFIIKVLIICYVLFFILATGQTWVFEAGFIFLFGWAAFLIKKIPEMSVNAEGLAMGLVGLALLVYCGHRFLTWLYAHWGQGGKDAGQDQGEPDAPARLWPLRWTAGLVALLFLFFGASIGFIGTAHQTAWMITSDKPLLKSSWGYKARAYQSDAKSSLRNIYLACKAYWADHGSDRSCNLNIAQTTTYSYIQSRDVVITAGGSEKEFHGIAGHLRDNGWFMINPKGEIEEIKESDSGS